MKSSLLNQLVCPFCRTSLILSGAADSAGIVQTGELDCTSCHKTYKIQHGIPNMLHAALPNVGKKLNEIDGWIALASKEKWYIPDDKIDGALPYLVRDLGWTDSGWWATQISFERLLSLVKPGMNVLEVGAAKCWSSRYFLERGCAYTACDILADSNMGLGRGQFYIDRHGYFERVQGDGERLPFKDNTFDLTYCIAALHHAIDLRQMIREMARVTRRGGHVVALNEGSRPFTAGPDAELQSEEKLHGINEHVHFPTTYLREFWFSRLFVQEFSRAIGYEHIIGEPRRSKAKQLLRLPLGQYWAAIYTLGFGGYDGVSLIGKKWL